MKDAHFYVYNVGHGVCTLLTGTKDDGSEYCGVFDCGTKASNPACDRKVVYDHMIQKITNIGHIDDVVFSHQDRDHHSMFLTLFFGVNNINESNDFGIQGRQMWKKMGKNTYYTFKKLKGEDHYEYVFHRYTKNLWVTREINWDITAKNVIIAKVGLKKKNKNSELQTQCTALIYSFLDLSKYNLIFSYGSIMFNKSSNDLSELYDVFENDQYPVLQKVPRNLKLNTKKELEFLMERISDDTFKNELSAQLYSPCLQPLYIKINSILFGGGSTGMEYEFLQSLMNSIYDKRIKAYPNGAYLRMNEFAYVDKPPLLSSDLNIRGHKGKPNIGTLEIMRNATSLVVQFVVDTSVKKSILLPGDVTVHKIASLNNKIKNPKETWVFLAPHHGSDNTNFKYTSGGTMVGSQPIEDLLSLIFNIKLNNVISAYHSINHHPGNFFFCKSMAKLFPKSVTLHKAVYYDATNRSMVSCNTNKAIFTTNCEAGNGFYLFSYTKNSNIYHIQTNYKEQKVERRIPSDKDFI